MRKYRTTLWLVLEAALIAVCCCVGLGALAIYILLIGGRIG